MAQLVARLVRNEKVGGSNPPSSTTGRHPIRMSVFCMHGCVVAAGSAGVPGAGGPAVGPGCLVCPWAAARPRAVRAASFARRVVSKPGQALPPPMGTAAMPSGPSGVLHTGNAWSADVRLGASPRSPARPCRRPWAPQPDPPAPAALFIVVVPGIFSNFARNSLATCSNLEFASLGLQRFRVVSKSDRGKLCAKFVWLCSCCRPPAPRRGAPAPSARFTPVGPGVLLCWLA